MYPNVQLYINGAWRNAEGGRTIDVVNPADETVIGSVAHAGDADLRDTVAAAQAAFDTWRKTPAFDRCQIMLRAARLLRERASDIGRLMTLEQGKPMAQSSFEAARAAGELEWAANEGLRSYGRTIPARKPGSKVEAAKFPIGPVALFTPWNFPINQLARKLGPALAAGCTVIAKAPEETPAAPAELVRAFIDAGLPAGVLNLLYGDPARIAGHLIESRPVRKISFTGSVPVGKLLAEQAGRHMKRLTMELGGHAPVLIFDDADVDLAISQMSAIKYFNAGQTCATPNRFIVHDSQAEAFTQGFVRAARAVKVGDGLDPRTQMGPLANPRRLQALQDMVRDATQRGANILTGGKRIGDRGYYFEPTVIANAPIDAMVRNVEAFGPVSVISTFSTYDEAVTEANRLEAGLVSYAYTRALATVNRLSEDVEAGNLVINDFAMALPEMPYGGIKESGYGVEGGSEAIAAYQFTKLVSYAY